MNGYKFLLVRLKVKDNSEEMGIDGRILLKLSYGNSTGG
jgi:hypothetical protein